MGQEGHEEEEDDEKETDHHDDDDDDGGGCCIGVGARAHRRTRPFAGLGSERPRDRQSGKFRLRHPRNSRLRDAVREIVQPVLPETS